ncbi:MAG: hypothetical protein H7Y02_14275 [Candidatus Obscuribacterales bacterium]|nr:hypothetical protein [Steroidobacteraceae bacterium]
MYQRSKQCGLTLPETLAALVALAIVILSIASVYLERSRAVPGLALRQEAHDLASELAARIESNMANAARDGSAIVFYENPVGVLCRPELKPGLRSNPKAPQPHDIAANEVACWQAQVNERLPSGAGAISLDSISVPAAYIITVSWSQPGVRTASYVLRVAAAAHAISPAPIASDVKSEPLSAARAAN